MISAIHKRLSVRKYQEESLNSEMINKIKNIIDNEKPLFDHLHYKIDIVLDGKSFQKVLGGIIGSYGKVHAPHYLVASVKNEVNSHENIGYLLENVVLKLTQMGIGTCWIGGGISQDLFKDFLKLDDELNPIVVIAFGKPSNHGFREDITQFKRKSISQISEGKHVDNYKEAMELVRLAPSAVNLQPWRYYFEVEKRVDLYRVKQNFLLKSHLEEMNRIDLGISISHFIIGMNQLNKRINIVDNPKKKTKLIYYKSFLIE